MNAEDIKNVTDEELDIIVAEAEAKEATQEPDAHQVLMDKAYADERKRANASADDSWCYNRMIREGTELERLAVVLGNLNYQVENGGFNQWIDNGYCTGISDAKEALEAIDTETCRKIIPMLEEVEKYLDDSVIDGTMESRGCGGHYFDDEKCDTRTDTCYECGGSGEIENPNFDWDDEECEEEQMIECSDCDGEGETEGEVDYPDFSGDYRCSNLDSAFYEINTQFLEDIKEYIVKKQN